MVFVDKAKSPQGSVQHCITPCSLADGLPSCHGTEDVQEESHIKGEAPLQLFDVSFCCQSTFGVFLKLSIKTRRRNNVSIKATAAGKSDPPSHLKARKTLLQSHYTIQDLHNCLVQAHMAV